MPTGRICPHSCTGQLAQWYSTGFTSVRTRLGNITFSTEVRATTFQPLGLARCRRSESTTMLTLCIGCTNLVQKVSSGIVVPTFHRALRICALSGTKPCAPRLCLAVTGLPDYHLPPSLHRTPHPSLAAKVINDTLNATAHIQA
eukprot:2017444-Pleurochrysis_carterae.AAC.4